MTGRIQASLRERFVARGMKVQGGALLLVVLAAAALPGCATQAAASGPKAAESPANASPQARPRVALIPVESNRYKTLARAVNAQLLELVDRQAWDVKPVKIGIEDLQLSIECIEPSPACYAAVAKSLKVDRIHFGRLKAAGRRHVKLTLVLYDAAAGKVLTSVERRLPWKRRGDVATDELKNAARASLAVPPHSKGPPLLRSAGGSASAASPGS